MKGKPRKIRFTRTGRVRFLLGKRRWSKLRPRKRNRRLRRKVGRRNRRRRRRIRRRRRRIRKRRRRVRKRSRRRRIRGRKRKPRAIGCGMRVRLRRRWRRVIKRKRRFYVRYNRILRRVSFRKAKFRIRINRKWITRRSYHRIKVRISKKFRFLKRVTFKGAKKWTARCFGKRRPFRFRRGHRIVRIHKSWTRVTTHVVMKVFYRGKNYPVVRRRHRWFVRRGKKKFNRIRLRGKGFKLKFGAKWKKVPGAYLRVKVGRRWKTIKNCCKTLRLKLRGRTRKISLRKGFRVKYRGRKVHIRKLRRRVGRRRRRRRRHRRGRRIRSRRRRRRGGRRRRSRSGKKRTAIAKPEGKLHGLIT